MKKNKIIKCYFLIFILHFCFLNLVQVEAISFGKETNEDMQCINLKTILKDLDILCSNNITEVQSKINLFVHEKNIEYLILLLNVGANYNMKVDSISFENELPGNFEKYRHYGPKKVTDAVAAVLNQITKKDFGTIYNGTRNEDRENCIKKWTKWFEESNGKYRTESLENSKCKK